MSALGPTQSPVQWIMGRFLGRVERPEREGEHSPPSSIGVKHEMELYLSAQQGHLYLHFHRCDDVAWVETNLPHRIITIMDRN